ncbi:MAG TPA: hypothetical protein VMF50_12955 [Candidatus Binataceae bacterium]|nr:hypothetical protein [Candidatus Binataceae bacterium]
MESLMTIRRARSIRIVGFGALALWLGSAAIFSMPRTVHAQDDSAVSNDNGSAVDNSNQASDTEDQSDEAKAAPPQIAGSWSGTATDNRHGSGTVTMTFAQATRAVAATIWEVTYGDDSSAGGTGSGKLTGKSLRLVLLDPTLNKCTMDVSAKVTVDDGIAEEIKGHYELKKCFAKKSKGTLDLTPTSP